MADRAHVSVTGGSHTSPARTPRPRSIEGTHPSWVSMVRNVATPMGSDLGQYSPRKSGWRSQWEQEGPRSESQRPKGSGKA